MTNNNYNSYNIQKIPTVYITPAAKTRLDCLIESIEIEISGLGTVVRMGEDLLIEEILLFDQKCNHVETVLQTSDIARYQYQAILKGINTANLKLWWHSHHLLGCFWSSVDLATINVFGKTCDWFLSIVGCYGGKYLCSLDIYKPFRISIPVPLVIYLPPVDAAQLINIQEEIAQKVTVITPPPVLKPKRKKKEVTVCPTPVTGQITVDKVESSPPTDSTPGP